MLDIKFIKENVEKIKEAVRSKNIHLDVDELLSVDDRRMDLLKKIEDLKAEKNQINEKMKTGIDRESLIAEGKRIKEEIEKMDPEYQKIKKQFDELMVKVPTIPSEDTPIGKDDSGNVEFNQWGEIPKMDFIPKTHIEIGRDLDILDLERGAKVGGYRGYYVKNEGVSLIMGVMMYAINKMVERGYNPMIPPTLVKGAALFGSGYFKGVEYDGEVDEIYQVATSDKEADGTKSKDKKFLVGTAEPSLLAYFSDEVLDESQLPIKVCGYSQCYRSEIGSYGKDTKGMYRVHEFMKVEQVVISRADIDESDRLQKEMVEISKELHQDLGLPYRQIQICTGDMSAGKYKAFDIEAWLPGLNRWGETGSASNFLDWQARRLNVKYKTKEGERKFVYMLNNTALPSPRVFIAILENYQQADGSVKIPEVLQKYMPGGTDVILPKK